MAYGRHLVRLFTPDAYLFDDGKRLSLVQIPAFVARLVAGGKGYTRTVRDPDMRFDCRAPGARMWAWATLPATPLSSPRT